MRGSPRISSSKAASVSLLFFVVLAIGCRGQEEVVPTDRPPEHALHIGLIPEHNLFSQKRRYEPLAEYLAEKLPARVHLTILSRYGNIIENFVSNDLEGAFFGSFTGALALRVLNVEALARPEYSDGTSTYHGLIFVRRDSGITSAEDMRGKRFAFVDKATTAGWLLPLQYFKTHGVDDHRSWLKEAYFTGTHEGAIYDVLEGRADIGAAKNTVFRRLAESDPRVSNQLVILARSPDVPENALLVRKDLEQALKTKLRETLLNMDQDKEGREILDVFGALRFIPTTEADYHVVFEFAETIGLDLTTYDYTND